MFYSLQRDEFGHEQRGKLEGDAAMSGMRSDRDHVMPRQCYVLQIQICSINHEISKFFFLPLARIMSSNQILHLPQTARQTREGETISLLPRNDNKGEGRVWFEPWDRERCKCLWWRCDNEIEAFFNQLDVQPPSCPAEVWNFCCFVYQDRKLIRWLASSGCCRAKCVTCLLTLLPHCYSVNSNRGMQIGSSNILFMV